MSKPVNLHLPDVPQVSSTGGKFTAYTMRQLDDALRVTRRNFQRIKELLERGILSGDIVPPGSIGEDDLSAAAKLLIGDVTGTIGASGGTTVEKIRGRPIAQPGVGEDGYLARYVHGTTSIDWVTFASIVDDILTTSGDLLYRSGSTITRLALGSALSLLAVNAGGTAPAYTTLTALIDAAIGNTRGSVLYRGVSGWAALAPDTAGFVLQDGGAGADPSWGDASGGTAGVDFDLLTDEDGLVLDDGEAIWT